MPQSCCCSDALMLLQSPATVAALQHEMSPARQTSQDAATLAPGMHACSSSSRSCLPACTRVTAQKSRRPTPCTQSQSCLRRFCSCTDVGNVQPWHSSTSLACALRAQLPASPFCFLGALPGRRGRCSLSAGPPKMKGHISPERAALPSLLEKNAERTPWHVHPSVNPSSFHVSASMLWQPFVQALRTHQISV